MHASVVDPKFNKHIDRKSTFLFTHCHFYSLDRETDACPWWNQVQGWRGCGRMPWWTGPLTSPNAPQVSCRPNKLQPFPSRRLHSKCTTVSMSTGSTSFCPSRKYFCGTMNSLAATLISFESGIAKLWRNMIRRLSVQVCCQHVS